MNRNKRIKAKKLSFNQVQHVKKVVQGWSADLDKLELYLTNSYTDELNNKEESVVDVAVRILKEFESWRV